MWNKIITIKRTHYREDGTFGVIDDEGEMFALTVELPWKDNQQNVSCIPEGEYDLKRKKSHHFGEVFEVLNVPNRTDVLIHPANTKDDLKGCIGLGEQFEPIGSLDAVLLSRQAVSEFMKRMKGFDYGKLVILKRS